MESPLRCPLCTSPCSLLLLLTELHCCCGLTLHLVCCSLPLSTIFTLLLLWCHFSFYCFMTFLLSSCQCFFPFCLPCPSPAESDLSETGRCAHLLPASGSHVWKSYTGKKPAWTDEASWGSLCFLPESVVSYLCGCTHFLFAFSTHVWENGTGKVLVSVENIFFHAKQTNKKILNNQRYLVALKKLVLQKRHVHNTRAQTLVSVTWSWVQSHSRRLSQALQLTPVALRLENGPLSTSRSCYLHHFGGSFSNHSRMRCHGSKRIFRAVFYIS